MNEMKKQDGQSAQLHEKATRIPGYKNNIRDTYRLDDGTEVAIFYPQAIQSIDEEMQ